VSRLGLTRLMRFPETPDSSSVDADNSRYRARFRALLLGTSYCFPTRSSGVEAALLGDVKGASFEGSVQSRLTNRPSRRSHCTSASLRRLLKPREASTVSFDARVLRVTNQGGTTSFVLLARTQAERPPRVFPGL